MPDVTLDGNIDISAQSSSDEHTSRTGHFTQDLDTETLYAFGSLVTPLLQAASVSAASLSASGAISAALISASGEISGDSVSSAGPISAAPASAAGHVVTLGQGDDSYGRLASANTWAAGNTFTLPVVAPDATADTHALNRQTGDWRYGRLASANTWAQSNTFSLPVIVPAATADTHALNRQTSDGRYGKLAGANTWTLSNTFTSTVVVPDATADTHALNRQTGDGRYGRLVSANTWTGANNTFTSPVVVPNATTSTHALNMQTGDGRYGRLAYTNTWVGTNSFSSYLYFNGSTHATDDMYVNSLLIYEGSYSTNSTIIQANGYLHYRADNAEHRMENRAGTDYGTIRYGTAIQSSDMRVKTDVTPVSKAESISLIRSLDVIDYRQKSNPEGRRISGFNGQQIAALFPDAVTRDEKDEIGVDYTSIFVRNVAVTQEHDKLLAELESRVSALEIAA